MRFGLDGMDIDGEDDTRWDTTRSAFVKYLGAAMFLILKVRLVSTHQHSARERNSQDTRQKERPPYGGPDREKSEIDNKDNSVRYFFSLFELCTNCVVLVDAVIEFADGDVSIGCDGDKIVSSRWVKFGSCFSRPSSGGCGHCALFDSD